jgi:hypothetical protein
VKPTGVVMKPQRAAKRATVRGRVRPLAPTEPMPNGRRLDRYAVTCEGERGVRERMAYVDMRLCGR